MPARPPIRPASRPAFRPPVSHSTPPSIRPSTPPSFRPPVHHDNPPVTRPPPPPTVTHRPVIPPIVTNAFIINSMTRHDEHAHQDPPLHESDDFKGKSYEQPLPALVKICQHCGETITSGDTCPTCTLTRISDREIMDTDFDDDSDNISPLTIHEKQYGKPRPVTRASRYSRKMPYNEKGFYGLFMVTALFIVIAFIYIMPLFNFVVPSAVAYKHGPFQVNSLHFVDGNNGMEYAGVEYFELYVTNNSERYDDYAFITNGTGSVSHVLAALASIPESVYYLQVVLYSDGYAPYGDSWDIITSGNNWVYLYPIP
jgi:hypothetical protein